MYNKTIFAIAAAVLAVGCAKQEPVKTAPAQPKPAASKPKQVNGSTVTETFSDGTVYASEKNNYLRACQNGDGAGCRNLSTLYEKGLGVPKNPEKALYYVERGCQLGYGPACNRAGNYFDSNDYGVRKNAQKAAEYYMQGCELNHGMSCNNIGFAYISGEGVVRNFGLAETYLKKAIGLGNNSHNNLGYLYEIEGKDADAQRHYVKSCDLNDKTGCGNLGNFYMNKKSYVKAYNAYIKACNLGNGTACQNASMMIYRKQVTPENPNDLMFKLSANACELGSKTGCADTGYSYETGLGVPKDMKKAKEFYKKACKLGDKSSCNKF